MDESALVDDPSGHLAREAVLLRALNGSRFDCSQAQERSKTLALRVGRLESALTWAGLAVVREAHRSADQAHRADWMRLLREINVLLGRV